jgi:5,10-methylenetetrahydrofolate reductase
MQGGKDMAGHALTGLPEFFIGTEINTGGGDRVLETELEKLKEKMELGVEFIVTGPIFDPRRFKEDLKRIDTDRVAVIATVLVLKSAGMARYVDRNVKNISVPPELIKRLEKAAERSKEGLKIAGELIAEFKDLGLSGTLVSTRGWDKKLPQILDAAGL